MSGGGGFYDHLQIYMKHILGIDRYKMTFSNFKNVIPKDNPVRIIDTSTSSAQVPLSISLIWNSCVLLLAPPNDQMDSEQVQKLQRKQGQSN